MKLPGLFIGNLFRIFSDSASGQKALHKIFTALLFLTTIFIEAYTMIYKDCVYSLEFVITNFTFIAASLGISVFGGVMRTKHLSMQAQNCNGNGNGNGNGHQSHLR
jgi:hypothetical protein